MSKLKSIAYSIIKDVSHSGRTVLYKEDAEMFAKALLTAERLIRQIGTVESADRIREADKWIETYFPQR